MPKTTFVATSPFTGEQFTRKSEREYTFAVVRSRSIDAIRKGRDEAATCEMQQAIKYNEIATFLENGTTPDASHKLCKPLGSVAFTINEYRAGVRTEWDSIEYDIIDGKFADTYSYVPRKTRAEKAAEYRTYAKNSAEHAEKLRTTVVDKIRQSVTFHHTEALARKAMSQNKDYWTGAIVVPCVPKQK